MMDAKSPTILETWAVVCDAREGAALGIKTLALVDRTKSRAYWWTSDNTEIILRYRKRHAANYAANRLQHNRARVVPYMIAYWAIDGQRRGIAEELHEREHKAIMNSIEEG